MAEIYLRNINDYALVDDENYDLVKAYTWFAYKKPADKKYYVRANPFVGFNDMGKRRYQAIHLHRIIADAGERDTVTFKNRNSLDCRRENLIVLQETRQGVCFRPTPRKYHDYRGVTATPQGTYTAEIRVDGHTYYLGRYRTAERAALAYDAKAKELLGDIARLNFPNVSDYSNLSARTTQGVYKRRNTKSQYMGVRPTGCKTFYAEIKHHKKTYYLGSFKTEREAAEAYDRKAIELRGKDTPLLNFPLPTERDYKQLTAPYCWSD